MIEKLLKTILFSCLFFVVSAFFAVSADAAPRLYFDPSTYTSNRDSDFQIKIQIDVESQSAFGADVVVTFPSADLTVKSVSNGGFFSDFSSAPSSGKLELHGFFSASYESKSGSGTFATLTLSSNKDSGSGTASFTCTGSGNDTQILNSAGNNILSCGSLNQLSINYTASSSDSDSPAGEPNSCGGTCGSHYNCKAGLFCFQGYCRNPDCSSQSNCVCAPTPKSTVKPAAKPKINPTPEIVILTETPPTPAPELTATPTSTPEAPEERKLSAKTIGAAAVILLIITAILIIIARLFRRSGPPKINPPSTGFPTPPVIPTPPVPPTIPPQSGGSSF